MKLRFWGVRGSFATPGPEFLRYGGNTSAIELRSDAGHRLLVDLGTGVTELAKELMAEEFGRGGGTLPVLLTHTHLDHIQGLPFFTPFFIKGNQIRILGLEPEGVSLAETLQSQLNGHYSPLYGLENLAAGVTIDTISPGSPLPVEGFEVKAVALPHGGMSVLGFRVEADGVAVALLTDVEYPSDEPLAVALELARDADLLVHDAMFTDSEYESRRGWGHSSVSAALRAATESGARRLALFHHSPDSTDADIDRIVEELSSRSELRVFAASEGAVIDV